MAIDDEIQDEEGLTIARYDGPPLGIEFIKLAPPGSACFRFIDPCGDATFNQAQIEVLNSELRLAAKQTEHSRRLSELEALASFVEGATGVHVYLKFIGD